MIPADDKEEVRIMIVEDEVLISKDLEKRLNKIGYSVCCKATSAEKALELVEMVKPSLVLMDIVLKGEMDGIEVAEEIKNKWGVPVVFLTAYGDAERLERAKLTYPFGYILKPYQERDLKITVEMALYVAKADEERKKVEKALRESRERYKGIFENSFNGIAVLRAAEEQNDFIVLTLNDRGAQLEMIGAEPVSGKMLTDVINGAYESGLFDIVKRVWKTGNSEHFTSSRYIENRVSEWREYFIYRLDSGEIVAVYSDETERKQAEEAVAQALIEKEVLLSEIHHRVKNNLTIISNFLQLQLLESDDPLVKKALDGSISRIYAMSSIHDIAYRSDLVSQINVKDYLERLIKPLTPPDSRITFNIMIDEGLKFSVKTAVPGGLVLNELITNALKYAYPEGRRGEITIQAEVLGDKKIKLVVSDQGVGLAEGCDWKNADSLGLQLVRMLTEKQMGGTIELNASNGVRWDVTIPM